MKNYTEVQKDNQHRDILTEQNKSNFRLSKTYNVLPKYCIIMMVHSTQFCDHSVKVMIEVKMLQNLEDALEV